MTLAERIQATTELMVKITTPEQSIDAILANQLAIMQALRRLLDRLVGWDE